MGKVWGYHTDYQHYFPSLQKYTAERSENGATIYRHVFYPDKLLTTPFPNVHNLTQFMKELVKQFGPNPCLGSRDIIKAEWKTMPNGKKVEVFEFKQADHIVYETYNQTWSRINNIAKGLLELLQLPSNPKRLQQFNNRLGVYEETCKEWLLMAHGCFLANITVVTVYSNLGEEALVQAIQETELEILFVNQKALPLLLSVREQIPTVKYLIVRRDITVAQSDAHYSQHRVQFGEKGVTLVEFNELESKGKHSQVLKTEDDIRKVKPDAKEEDLAVIMYTSGTTGAPKGVMLLHRSILAAMAASATLFDPPNAQQIRPPQTNLGYLPLAHIFAIIVDHGTMLRGGKIGYGSPKTLTEKTVINGLGDLKVIQPTFLAAVPQVLDTLKKAVQEEISNKSSVVQFLFKEGFESRLKAVYEGRETPIWNLLLFNKLKDIVGGKLDIVLSGGAPLSEDTMNFVKVCFTQFIIQGYGLTETSAVGAVQNIHFPTKTKSVGPMSACCEIKLIDVPDMNYFTTDKPHPRGEIAIRGPNLSLGYFKKEDLTKEVYTEDGWFLTGDVGQYDSKDGTLSIIDRKKNLIKMAQGEYVATEKIEAVYGNSKFVAPKGIFVYGDSYNNFLVAIVLPQMSVVRKHATEVLKIKDVPSMSDTDLVNHPQVKEAMQKDFVRLEQEGHLKHFEHVKEFRCFPLDEWTPNNGMLTVAMKMKRNSLSEHYKTTIQEMYANHVHKYKQK